MTEPLCIGSESIAPGERRTIELPLPPLATHSGMNMPIHVLRGRRPGPRLLVCAALHGDEINGVEIIRRLVGTKALKGLRGDLIAVPIVNVYGFIHRSRYLPDRRDLNRSFPGLEQGSLAARLAHLFLGEIVSRCTHGIDLHTAAIHRDNYPQVRACISDPAVRMMAEAFQAPIIIDAALREGTIREAAAGMGIPWLVYEAGEALRFDEVSIRAGVHGVLNVMRELGMLRQASRKQPFRSRVARSNQWVRAPQSGILRLLQPLGALVSQGDLLGIVSGPYGDNEVPVVARMDGIIIGRTNIPLVQEGDAVAHIARFRDNDSAAEAMETFHSELDPEGEGSFSNVDEAPII